MSVLTDYTAEQQRILLGSLPAAAIAVAAASPGRSAETVSEILAAATYILDSRSEFLTNTLVNSIQFDIQLRADAGAAFPNFAERAEAPGALEDAHAALRAVAALLDTLADPNEAAGFKQWLMNIAVHTALGGKEGGNWRGKGAVQVNDAERAAVRAIAEILGVPHE
jgi:hypothetical protein